MGGTAGGGGGGGKEEEEELPEELQHLEKAMVDKIMQEIQQRGDPVTFDQIAGLEFAKKSVVELVCWPMARPDIFTGLRSLPKGLLLFGPPGTGDKPRQIPNSVYELFQRRMNGLIVRINPFTTENPFLGTKLLGFSIGRGSGAPKGLTPYCILVARKYLVRL